MGKFEERVETSEGLMTYELLLQAAEHIVSTSVLICPDADCSRTATVEVSSDGEETVRVHASGRHDSVTGILKKLHSADPNAHRVQVTPCPEHADYFAKTLVKMGVVIDPEDHRSPEEIYYSLVDSSLQSI